jgi:uncharacterized cupin superfamily protein
MDSSSLLCYPIWTKEVSEFPCVCAEQESRYFIASNAVITTSGGEPASMEKSDIVIYPKEISKIWRIAKNVSKYYAYGSTY